MEKKDITKCFDLENKCFGYKVRFDKEMLFSRLYAMAIYGYSYVAIYKKEIIGHLISFVTRDGDIYIDYLCVDFKYKRKGVGRALINKLKSENPRSNLFLRTTQPNSGAIKFYLTLGFEIFKIDDDETWKDIILRYKR